MQQGCWNIPLLLSGLKRCRNTNEGKSFHTKAIDCGSIQHPYVATAVITMYSKYRCMEDAYNVFKNMENKNVVSWTALILGYVENGDSISALELFYMMDCQPDHVTILVALKACSKLATLDKVNKQDCFLKGTAIHNKAKMLGLDMHLHVANSLVDMYSKCGEMTEARRTFDCMLERDVVSWNILIFGYTENNEHQLALEVFYSMKSPPNHLSFLAAVKSCTGLATGLSMEKLACLKTGEALHKQALKLGFDKDVTLMNALISLYSKCGDMFLASRVFNQMRERSVVSWTALMLGYLQNGDSLSALKAFSCMDCLPDRVTFVAALKACKNTNLENDSKETLMRIHKQLTSFGLDRELVLGNTLIYMYCKLGDVEKARKVFENLVKRDIVSWNTLISGYVEKEEFSIALETFNSIDCSPDAVSFATVLKACVALAAGSSSEKEIHVQKALSIHRKAVKLGCDGDPFVTNALVELFSKCGDMNRAHATFNRCVKKDVVSWTTLMAGYVENGSSRMALELFCCMDCTPDSVSFVTTLKACGALRAIDMGKRIHAKVCMAGLEGQELVATCLVDFYGKCGEMVAAESVFGLMQSRNTVLWTALMGGYGLIGDTFQVFELAGSMKEYGVQVNDVTMQLVLTACSHAGLVERCESYFKSMLRNGIKPSLEHYACMIDLLGRVNRLEEAVDLLNRMPYPANDVVWTSLLGACRKSKNSKVRNFAFNSFSMLSEDDSDRIKEVPG